MICKWRKAYLAICGSVTHEPIFLKFGENDYVSHATTRAKNGGRTKKGVAWVEVKLTGRVVSTGKVPVFRLLCGPKNGVFAPQGRHITPFKCDIWHGGAKFHVYSGRNVGNTAPKTLKICNFAHKFAP